MKLNITTLNANGIRAADKRGLSAWINDNNFDVLALQEVRANRMQCEEILENYKQLYTYESQIKGRSGVALVNYNQNLLPFEVTYGLSGANCKATFEEITEETTQAKVNVAKFSEVQVDTGRWLEVIFQLPKGLTIKKFRVISCYFHSGEVGSPRQEEKVRHLDYIDQRMQELLNDSIPTVIVGDFNVVRSELDIKNWKGNHNKTAGVLDEEITYLNRWVLSGWKDSIRELAGESQGPYTWWSWRGKAFDNDAGWRIDYQFHTPEIESKNYLIHRAKSYDERISDHAAVTVEYEI